MVLLEATVDSAQPFSAAQVRGLQESLDIGRSGGALRSGDRYALQLTATGAGPIEALLTVVARWATAVRDLGLPPSRLVRTEVCTPEELDREFEESERESPPREPWSAAPRLCAGDVGDELLRRAFSDPLTGLLAREAFVRQVDVTLTRFDVAVVVCLDLDGFRGPNGVLSGATRDHVMLTLARRLVGMLRSGDVLARIGVDAFGVLLAAGEEAGLIAARRLIAAARTPIGVSGRDVVVSASAGVAVGHRGDPGALVFGHAEAALAAARPAGREPVVHALRMTAQPEPAEASPTPALQDPLANVQLLQQAAVAANEADTLEQAAQVVARQVGNYVSGDVSQVWVAPAALAAGGPTGGWQLVSSTRPATHQVAEDFLAGPMVGLAGRVVSTRRPAWMPDIAVDDEGAGGLRSAFAFPVTVGSEVVAVLAFFSSVHMEPSGSFEDVVTGIATQLGRLVERQRAAVALRGYAEQLRASEARLREVHFAGRLGSWHIDLRSGESSRTDGMRELYGIDPAERLDLQRLLSPVDPRDRGRAEAALWQLARTGKPTTEEIRIRDASGQARWLRVQGSALRDDNEEVVAIYGTAQDINEARQAQEQLVDRERQMAEAQRTAGLGWWERDLCTGRLVWSDHMYRLWRWDPEKPVSSEAVIATVHVDDRQRLLQAVAQLRMTARPFCVDFRACRADGQLRWFRSGGHLVSNHAGAPVKLFGTVQDVTEQRQAAEELRSSKLLYQRIVETTREGIVTVDAQNRITFVNARLGQLLGYGIDEMRGMAATSVLGPVFDALLSGHAGRRRQRLSEHYEAHLQAKDGTTLHALLTVSPFVTDDGEYIGALAMVSDVTAVRDAEEILRQSVRTLDGHRRPPVDDIAAMVSATGQASDDDRNEGA
ncbi:MAG TPA: PAS domain S-box protein [Acidimicrobiales bacterium]|nr:PAS domain S-box protein [Acidimicrobiales bacterium]